MSESRSIEDLPIDICYSIGWIPMFFYGNYMRKCASGGQSLANAERGVEMCGFVGKIGTEFFITNVHLYIIMGNPGPNILVAHFRM